MDYRFQFRIREGSASTLQHGSRSVVRTGILVRGNWHTRLLAGSFIAPDTVRVETPTAHAFGTGERREEVEHATSYRYQSSQPTVCLGVAGQTSMQTVEWGGSRTEFEPLLYMVEAARFLGINPQGVTNQPGRGSSLEFRLRESGDFVPSC